MSGRWSHSYRNQSAFGFSFSNYSHSAISPRILQTKCVLNVPLEMRNVAVTFLSLKLWPTIYLFIHRRRTAETKKKQQQKTKKEFDQRSIWRSHLWQNKNASESRRCSSETCCSARKVGSNEIVFVDITFPIIDGDRTRITRQMDSFSLFSSIKIETMPRQIFSCMRRSPCLTPATIQLWISISFAAYKHINTFRLIVYLFKFYSELSEQWSRKWKGNVSIIFYPFLQLRQTFRKCLRLRLVRRCTASTCRNKLQLFPYIFGHFLHLYWICVRWSW